MLDLFFGSTSDQVVEVKADGDWHRTSRFRPEPGHIFIRGYVVGWSRAIVSTFASESGLLKTFVLAPANEDGDLTLGTFKVIGLFTIEEKITDTELARERFEESGLVMLR